MAILYTENYQIPYITKSSTYDLSYGILKNMVWKIDDLVWGVKTFTDDADAKIIEIQNSLAYTRHTTSVVQIPPTISVESADFFTGKDYVEKYNATGGALPTMGKYDWWYEWEFLNEVAGQEALYPTLRNRDLFVNMPDVAVEGADLVVRCRIKDEIGNVTEWSNTISKKYSNQGKPAIVSHSWSPVELIGGSSYILTLNMNDFFSMTVIPDDNGCAFSNIQVSGSTVTMNVTIPSLFSQTDLAFGFTFDTPAFDGYSTFTDTFAGNASIDMLWLHSTTTEGFGPEWHYGVHFDQAQNLWYLISPYYSVNYANNPMDGVIFAKYDATAKDVIASVEQTVTDEYAYTYGSAENSTHLFSAITHWPADSVEITKVDKETLQTIQSISITGKVLTGDSNIHMRDDGNIIWLVEEDLTVDKLFAIELTPDLTYVQAWEIPNALQASFFRGRLHSVDGGRKFIITGQDDGTIAGTQGGTWGMVSMLFDAYTMELITVVDKLIENPLGYSNAHYQNAAGNIIAVDDLRSINGYLVIGEYAPDMRTYVTLPKVYYFPNEATGDVEARVIYQVDGKYYVLANTDIGYLLVVELDANLENPKVWTIGENVNTEQGFSMYTYNENPIWVENGKTSIFVSGYMYDSESWGASFALKLPLPLTESITDLYETTYGVEIQYQGDALSGYIVEKTPAEVLAATGITVHTVEPRVAYQNLASTPTDLSGNIGTGLTYSNYTFDIGESASSFSDTVVAVLAASNHDPDVSAGWTKLCSYGAGISDSLDGNLVSHDGATEFGDGNVV